MLAAKEPAAKALEALPPKVLVVMGSDSDWRVMKQTVATLREFQVACAVEVASAHRSPEKALGLSATAREKGFRVIIAGAGGAAHLAGVLAAKTTLPVIGVPIGGGALGGLDALYATVQMPAGVPVATVAIDGGKNAALLAIQILALREPALAAALATYKEKLARQVEEKSARLQSLLPQD
ncbi:MAG: 5-(carboxyamino)imidazole ribonucleotide mutase [Peptococcaceae bacterium]|jgi:5-(carboxyamino)imidazole ribonucleotide mutase|nr:5-(carboxyamino)imidazole ribonucleotide mutase [Peptococcaceae bacterium]